MDEYLAHAIRKAQELGKTDGRFSVAPDQDLEQGKNNRVVRGLYDGEPVVLKYYGEFGAGGRRHGVPASIRRGRERFFLRACASSGVIPRVMMDDAENVIVMEEVRGVPLERLYGCVWKPGRYELPEITGEELETLSRDIGAAHGRILKVALDDSRLRAFERDFFEGRDLEDHLEDAVADAETICDTVEGFGRPERETIELMRSSADVVLARPRALCKKDWNPGNALVLGGRLSAFIDFEECFVGTDLVYLGAVLDCFSYLRWDALRAGYESETGRTLTRRDLAAVRAMSHFNNWKRTVGLWKAGRLDEFWTPRVKIRFAGSDSVLDE